MVGRMNSTSLETFLSVHIVLVGIALIIAWRVLARRNLFRWTTAGFWAWAAFFLYYLANPFFSLLYGSLSRYKVSLYMAGGIDRGYWIMVNILVGMLVFFTVYIRTKTQLVTLRLEKKSEQITTMMLFILSGIITLSLYSLFSYRASLISTGRDVVIESGRFVGITTGYEYMAFIFIYVPILFFLMSASQTRRVLGWFLFGIFVLLSLPNGWSRYIVVSITLAATIIYTLQKKKSFPPIGFIAIFFLGVLILQARGHEEWKLSNTPSEIINTIPGSIHSVGKIFTSVDTSMLTTWYLESYIKDSISGYDYGIPFLNYAVSGWIPGRYFPDKYFLIDWLKSKNPDVSSPTIVNYMLGTKPSLMGSLYNNGGIIALIISMGVLGFLSKKMDGMLDEESPLIIRAMGVGWLSMMWIVWGSHDYWGLSVLGMLSIPIIILWIFAPKVNRMMNVQKHLQPVSTRKFLEQ